MIEVIAISSPKEFEAFVEFPFTLYKNHPYWVPPLRKKKLRSLIEIKILFSIMQTPNFLGVSRRKIVGRIAAMINWIEVKDLKRIKYALAGLM